MEKMVVRLLQVVERILGHDSDEKGMIKDRKSK